MIRKITAAIVLAASAVALASVTVTAASAAPVSTATAPTRAAVTQEAKSTGAQVIVHAGDTGTASAAACAITRGNYTGHRICGRYYFDLRWPDGHLETFIVGLDRSVWHIFQRYAGDPAWSGWQSLGGKAISGVYLHAVGRGPTIKVVGDDNHWWYNQWTGGRPAWTGWYRG